MPVHMHEVHMTLPIPLQVPHRQSPLEAPAPAAVAIGPLNETRVLPLPAHAPHLRYLRADGAVSERESW